MAKKKTDRPRHVSIYYEHLLYDLDFMSNENAGMILKMIVWYAMGDERSEKEIEKMERHINVLPPNERGWLTSLYKRLFKCIDDDIEAYQDVCKKRREAVNKRWEAKRSIQMNTNVSTQNDNNENTTISSEDDTKEYESMQMNTSEYQHNTTQLNTTRLNSTQLDSTVKEEEEDACEEKEKSEEPLKANDFVRIWNASIDGALKKSDTTPMKRLKVEELPSDAELRIRNALNIIEHDLSEKDIERICEAQKLDRNRISMRNVAKWYMVMAMKRYARVTMKSRDSSFGSFNWFVNYPLRIKKLFNGDIQ